MDTQAIETKGLVPAYPMLEKIYAAQSTADLVRLFASPGLRQLPLPSFPRPH